MPPERATLVTGGTGFVGRRLVLRLVRDGARVRLLVRPTSDVVQFHGMPVELAYGDVTDRDSVRQAVAGCDRLYHLAKPNNWLTPDPVLHQRVNVDGTRNVLDEALAAGVRKAVYVGSYLSLFEEQSPGSNHRATWIARYTASKTQGEQLALDMASRGLPVVSALPTAIYGPGDTTDAGRILVLYLRRRLPVQLDVRANMVYVDDVADGLVAAMERGRAGARYVLGGDNIGSRELLALLAEITGRRWTPPCLPQWAWPAVGLASELACRATRTQPLIDRDFVRYFSKPLFADSDATRKELGFAHTPPREGLRLYVEWLKAAHIIQGV
jgi:nucleoside-diphosphate-sugar epimerase